jgi:hypothetical protein
MALRRYLVLGEETDTAWCPDWYPLFVAAKYCNCPPWELLGQSIYWKDKALIAFTAENEARKILEAH